MSHIIKDVFPYFPKVVSHLILSYSSISNSFMMTDEWKISDVLNKEIWKERDNIIEILKSYGEMDYKKKKEKYKEIEKIVGRNNIPQITNNSTSLDIRQYFALVNVNFEAMFYYLSSTHSNCSIFQQEVINSALLRGSTNILEYFYKLNLLPKDKDLLMKAIRSKNLITIRYLAHLGYTFKVEHFYLALSTNIPRLAKYILDNLETKPTHLHYRRFLNVNHLKWTLERSILKNNIDLSSVHLRWFTFVYFTTKYSRNKIVY